MTKPFRQKLWKLPKTLNRPLLFTLCYYNKFTIILVPRMSSRLKHGSKHCCLNKVHEACYSPVKFSFQFITYTLWCPRVHVCVQKMALWLQVSQFVPLWTFSECMYFVLHFLYLLNTYSTFSAFRFSKKKW